MPSNPDKPSSTGKRKRSEQYPGILLLLFGISFVIVIFGPQHRHPRKSPKRPLALQMILK
jgi:hypothetical protein